MKPSLHSLSPFLPFLLNYSASGFICGVRLALSTETVFPNVTNQLIFVMQIGQVFYALRTTVIFLLLFTVTVLLRMLLLMRELSFRSSNISSSPQSLLRCYLRQSLILHPFYLDLLFPFIFFINPYYVGYTKPISNCIIPRMIP
jgi:hypothetical protein